MLTVTTPAADIKLLSAEQMRLAAGVASNDTTRDAELASLNERISAEIADACRVAIANGREPTLKQETLSEDFRGCRRGPLVLSRRHNVEIVTVTADGQSLAADDYEVEAEAGLLHRLCGDVDVQWTERKVVVTYKAGFETIPPVLVGAASDLVRLRTSETSRDPLVKATRVKVEGIDETETQFWVNATSNSASVAPIPPEIMARLGRFMNALIG